jgi:hypothetical protein
LIAIFTDISLLLDAEGMDGFERGLRAPENTKVAWESRRGQDPHGVR